MKNSVTKNILNPIVILILCVCVTAISSCSRNNEYHKAQGVIWHTLWHATYQGNPCLADSIVPQLDAVGKSLSIFDEASLVNKVNNAIETVVDNNFIAVYNTSVKINRLTDKRFDPTLSPLITAWGFGKGHKATADTCRIDSIMKFVGIDKTRLSDNTLIKDDIRTEFNFSAIAKGYGCDMVARMFRQNNVNNFLIEIGGEIVASGVSANGRPWSVGIEQPSENEKSAQQSQLVINLTDCALATSGNYRNYHTDQSGKRFAHTISSLTGRPIQTDVLSATVIAPSCMEADALATSFMALGSESSKQLAKKLKYPVLLILNDHSVWMSDQMKKLVKK